MAEDFRSAVEDGLRLCRRIYFGNDERMAPKPQPAMERSSSAASTSHLPTCPMLYAVISNPEIVDNPDMPSYQPYVYGKIDPPALLPLQMNRISMEVDCYMDTAFVTVVGSWRVQCVMGSRSCDCRIAVPMGEQGSIMGIEVEVPMRSFCTKLSAGDILNDSVSKKGRHEKETAKIEDEPYLKPHIFTMTIPKIDGGTNLTVKIRWSQKLIYHDDQFTLQVPFTFPDYVTPPVKKIAKHESIQMNVSPGNGTEIICSTSSHPMKEQFRKSGKWGFLYDADVLSWSTRDFVFSYTLSSSSSLGTVLLSPSSSQDVDGRGMFYCYLFPGARQNEKAFKREMVFVVDISESMKGKLLNNTKKALLAGLAKLDPEEDMFNIIAFNSEAKLFSSSLCHATASCIEEATQWMEANLVPDGGTNILLPLNQGMEMFTDRYNSIPLLLLVTDGSVEDERHICKNIESHFTNHKNAIPRIHTLGLGSFCNQYFLRKLALLSGGHHEAVYDVDSIEDRLGRLIDRASSIFLADIAFGNLDGLSDVEVFPSRIPDLSTTSPLIVSGRYRGTFPEILQIKGNISVDIKVKEVEEENIPIRKLVAKQEIEQLTAEAWYKDSQDLRKKIADISVQNALVSEFTEMFLLETIRKKPKAEKTNPPNTKKVSNKVVDSHGVEESIPQKILVLRNIGIGFGDLLATADNISPGGDYLTGPESSKSRRSKCLGKLCNYCCCMCCIKLCSKINDQLATALTQLCCGFTCWGCFECCTSDSFCCCCECCCENA